MEDQTSFTHRMFPGYPCRCCNGWLEVYDPESRLAVRARPEELRGSLGQGIERLRARLHHLIQTRKE